MHTELLTRPAPSTPPASPVTAAAAPARLDLYAGIHKALRLAMSDTLARIGSLDPGEADARAEALAQVHALCAMCRSHVAKENDHVHPMIEARRPGGSSRVADDHEEHLAAIDAIEAAALAAEAAPTPVQLHRLYRALARFVGENMEHMDLEETSHNALLWAAYTDAELAAIHDRILASLSPQEMAQVLHWMLPALSPAERAGLLGEMRTQAPPPAFEACLALAQARLAPADWRKLADALGLR